MTWKSRWKLALSALGLILTMVGYIIGWEGHYGFSRLSIVYSGLALYIPLIIVAALIIASIPIAKKFGFPLISRCLHVCLPLFAGSIAITPIAWFYDIKAYGYGVEDLQLGWYLSLVAGLLTLIISFWMITSPTNVKRENISRIPTQGEGERTALLGKGLVVILLGVGLVLILLGFLSDWQTVSVYSERLVHHQLSYQDTFSGFDLAIGTMIDNHQYSWSPLLLLPCAVAFLLFQIVEIVRPLPLFKKLRNQFGITCMIVLTLVLTVLLIFESDFLFNHLSAMDVSYDSEIGIGWFLCIIGLLIALSGNLISYAIANRNQKPDFSI
jgi:hypothetical protein